MKAPHPGVLRKHESLLPFLIIIINMLTFFSSSSVTVASTSTLTFKAVMKTPQLLLSYWQQGTGE